MPQPNILLVTVDSLRYDYVYRDGQIDTGLSTIREMASDSMEFRNAFANAPFTSDSFPTILGGTHAKRFSDIKGIERNRPYLPTILQEAGYTTIAVHSNPNLSRDFGYDRGVDVFVDTEEDTQKSTLGNLRNYFTRNVSKSSPVFSLAKKAHGLVSSRLGHEIGGMPYTDGRNITEKALETLSTGTEPIFLWVQYMDVHSPFYPHEGTVSEDIDTKTAVKTFNSVRSDPERATQTDVSKLKRLYEGELQHLDRILDNLMTNFRSTLNGETVVVFTSDHGEAFGEHGRYFHESGLWDENVRIPLFVDIPGEGSEVVETAVSNLDILPTVLCAADVEPPTPCDGSPLQTIDRADSERVVLAHSKGVADGEAMAATSDWKLVRDLGAASSALYDRTNDSEEREDVTEEQPQVASQLADELDSYLGEIRSGQDDATDECDVSGDTKDRLEALGYR